MPQNTTISIPANTWTQISDANVTVMRVCSLGTEPISLQATVGATPPSNLLGVVPIIPREVRVVDLAQLWPGVAGANRVYAYSSVAAKISVSNA